MKILSTIVCGTLMLVASTGFAVTKTDMDATKWICTTNASSSDVEADKAADKQMADVGSSSAKAYEFAAQNCRDCTKITCEVKD